MRDRFVAPGVRIQRVVLVDGIRERVKLPGGADVLQVVAVPDGHGVGDRGALAGCQEDVGVHLGAGAPPTSKQFVVGPFPVPVLVVPRISDHEPDVGVLPVIGLAVQGSPTLEAGARQEPLLQPGACLLSRPSGDPHMAHPTVGIANPGLGDGAAPRRRTVIAP